jgi:hypothetical protein
MAWTWALRLAAKERLAIADAFKLKRGSNDGTFALIDEMVTARLAAALAESNAEPIALAPAAAAATALSLAVALADKDPDAPKLAAACAEAAAEADADAPIPPPADSAIARLAAPAGRENETGGMLSSASSLANCELQRQPMIRPRRFRPGQQSALSWPSQVIANSNNGTGSYRRANPEIFTNWRPRDDCHCTATRRDCQQGSIHGLSIVDLVIYLQC